MLIAVNYKFNRLLFFCFCKAPSERLQCRTHLYLFIKLKQERFNFFKVEWCKFRLNYAHLLLNLRLLGRSTQLLLVLILDNAWLEPVLKLPLNRSHFIFKWIVTKLGLPLSVVISLLVRVVCFDLLFILLDKSWFKHVDAMVSVNLIWVVLKELFVSLQFILDRF
jgi:hypothetical protein